MMEMAIRFPGGMAVDAHFKGHQVHTDQPVASGGEDSGPSPFDLFLASLGTCAGFYVLRFCQQRQIDPSNVSLSLQVVRNPETRRMETIRTQIHLPPDFPEKYHQSVIRAADQCAVKRTLLDPPDLETVVTTEPANR